MRFTQSTLVCYCCLRSLWNPLEAFFEQQGYRLFIYENEEFDIPKNPMEIRATDPYHVFIEEPVPSRFYCTVSCRVDSPSPYLSAHWLDLLTPQRNKHCAATRLSDGTHVVLQLLAIGEDGLEEVEIQKRLHHRPISTEYRNRAVPLLQLIEYAQEKMIFGVFPLLAPGCRLAPHRKPREGLKHAINGWKYVADNQVAIGSCRVRLSLLLLAISPNYCARFAHNQAVAYLYTNLVAHLVRSL